MATLHLVFNSAGLDACLRIRGDDEPVVLLGDGVYHHAQVDGLQPLLPDCELRGVDAPAAISRKALVELTVSHAPIVSWSR